MQAAGVTGQKLKDLIWIIVQFEILCLKLGLFLGVISSVVDFSELCFKRYNFDSINSSSVSSNVIINANANYTMSEVVDGGTPAAIQSAGYNSWKKANFQISENQIMEIKAVGEISLCRSYLPKYHLQDGTNPLVDTGGIYYTKTDGSKIPIPRVSENTTPLTLIYNATTRGWRNLAEVYNGDIVKVILNDNVASSASTLVNPLTNPTSAADCNRIVDATARQNCLTALNAGQPAQTPNCASITDPDQLAACQAQFGGAPPAPQGLTVAQCNRYPAALVAQCIASIPSAPATPASPGPAPAPAPAPAPPAVNDPCASYTGANLLLCRNANPMPTPPANCPCGSTSLQTGLLCDNVHPVECTDPCANWTGNISLCRNANPVPADPTAADPCAAYSGDNLTLCRGANPVPTGPPGCACGTYNGSHSVSCATLHPSQCTDPCANWIGDVNLCRNANPEPQPVTPISVYSYSVTDSVTNTPTVANCGEGARTYSPICGRYSLWNGTTNYFPQSKCACQPMYATGHGTMNTRCQRFNCQRHSHCWVSAIFGCTFGTHHDNNCYHHCFICSPSVSPEPYLEDGTRTEPYFNITNKFLVHNYTVNPQGSAHACMLGYAPLLTRFWFSAGDSAGLQYRFHSQVFPGASAALGSNYSWATIVNPASDVYNDQYDGRKIYSDQFDSAPVAYLQYRFHGASEYTTQTGGYVLKLLHTKCRRVRGNYLTDSMTNRGAVEYLILPSGQDPNTDPTLGAGAQTLQFVNGITNLNSGSKTGFMWLKIRNEITDYPDSSGTYRITISSPVTYGSFTLQILNPLFQIFRDKVNDIALGTFRNMTCYQSSPSDSCVNFFTYLRALLMLYIMFLGFRFIMGANIKHEELMKSLLKIVIVIGLINGGTFEFFAQNIYPLITGFSDQIIANMSGFSMLSSTNSIQNPFMFLDALMSKMFLNPTFLFQLLTTMAMGITGIFYFLIICVSVIVFTISIFNAMAIYIMALLATSLLIGVAPIFISFILFERTYYLFENWAKFCFRYMMEPVIMMAGIIILTQLFTLYIDQVLSFSLCWKCALPFKIPFASLLPFPGLQNIPLFCIYWFSPWGLNPVNDPMGIDLAMVVGLSMVAYSAHGYVKFAGRIATRLVGGSGGPSSISLGAAMNQDFGNKVQNAALLAQDDMAKMLADRKDKGKGKGDGDAGGEGSDGGGGSGPNRDGPSMGALGDDSEGGTSDDGALKSGSTNTTPKVDLGGDAGSSDTDSKPASSDEAPTGGSDRAGTESVPTSENPPEDTPKDEAEQKVEEQKEKEEEVATRQDEQMEARLAAQQDGPSETTASLGEGFSEDEVRNLDEEEGREYLNNWLADEFQDYEGIEEAVNSKDFPEDLRDKMLTDPGSEETAKSLEDFLAGFEPESRDGIGDKAGDALKDKGTSSIND